MFENVCISHYKKTSQKLHTGFEYAIQKKLYFYFTGVFRLLLTLKHKAMLGIRSVYQTQCDVCGQNSIHK